MLSGNRLPDTCCLFWGVFVVVLGGDFSADCLLDKNPFLCFNISEFSPCDDALHKLGNVHSS